MSLLEPLVASPTRTRWFIAPYALATSSLGLLSIVCTLAWSAVVFGAAVVPAQPGRLVIALLTATLAMGMLAQVMAAFFILVPHAQPLTNLLEYPAWILSGLLVPLSVLPGPLQGLAWVLAPTWSVQAARYAAEGHGPFWYAIAMTIALSLVYWLLSSLMLSRFERIARRHGTLVMQ
jgi:ABC-2 type transport system permease protein